MSKTYFSRLLLFYSFFVLIVLTSIGQTTRFAVDKVKIAKDTLPTLPYQQSLEFLKQRKIEAFPSEKAKQQLIPANQINGFLGALHIAYYSHRPLTLSPDMIWLLIAQGFSYHINSKGKSLHQKITQHEKRKKIEIFLPEFRKGATNDWSKAFQMIEDSLRANTQKDFCENILVNFSTTTPKEKIAYQITLLHSLQIFFELDFATGCGIPYIELEGTPQDWELLKTKALALKKYDLDEWIEALVPVLDEFIWAAHGKANPEFWRNIYKHSSKTYSPEIVSGWIIKFFPYLGEMEFAASVSRQEENQQNTTHHNGDEEETEDMENEEQEYVPDTTFFTYTPNHLLKGDDYYLSNISTNNFPKGIVEYDFVWKDWLQDTSYQMTAAAGFVGFTENHKSKAIRPEISWFIYEKEAPTITSNYHLKWLATKPYYWNSGVLPADEVSTPAIFLPKQNKTAKESSIALQKYIIQEIKLLQKKLAKTNPTLQFTGTATIEFIVTWDGTVLNPKLVECTNPTIPTEDLLQIIKKMPKWKAAQKLYFTAEEIDGKDSEEKLYNVNTTHKIVVNLATLTVH